MTRVADHINADRLLQSFLDLAKINGPSCHEQPVADYLVARLEQMGFTIQFDTAHLQFGGEVGNLVAYWPGTVPTIPPIFLSTHMDTVLPTAGLQPVIKDGVIYSDGTTILGADDRAALAAYLEAIQVYQESGVPSGPIELILTVCEQPGLVGARYLDRSLVQSRRGYIFDSSGDVGQIILKGPYSSRLHLTFHGHQSHIGLNPEEGINAIVIAGDAVAQMRLGQVAEGTLANIGIIRSGELTSIIPGQADVAGEVRSFTAAGLQAQLDQMIAVAEATAHKHGGTVAVRVEKKYLGFDIAPDSQLASLAWEAAEGIRVKPWLTETLGGADTNVLNELGLECITLGLGFRNIHTFQEHISVENLVNTGRYAAALLQGWYEIHREMSQMGVLP